MRTANVSAAIVAGGRALRFGGQDKSRLVVEGRSIIVRQLDVLQQVAAEIFIVAPDAARFADLELPVHPDVRPGCGAIGGILTALERARHDRVVVVACDLPFLHAGLLARLAERTTDGAGAWVHTRRGPEPLLACYPRSTRDAVRRLMDSGQRQAATIASAIPMTAIDDEELAAFGSPDRLLTNVNSPADYARVQ